MSQYGPDRPYWANAYSSLGMELQASLCLAKTGKLDILKAARVIAEQKREACIRKKLRARLPNGEVIIVRDVVEKIVKWIDNFIVDGAMRFDPLTAALPWACVRFLLQKVISVTQVEGEGAILSDLEIISRLISRYREFEVDHIQPDSPIKSRLVECITKLYAGILTFLATTIKCFDRNDLSPTSQGISTTPGRARLPDILQRETELLVLAGVSDVERRYYLEDPVIRLVNPAVADERHLAETRHSELFDWISRVPITKHHRLNSDLRMRNSNTWLLDHPVYRSWRNSSASSTLFLQGAAGSGKSILCSAVIDSFLNEKKLNDLAAPVAYFYCASTQFERERALPSEILRSLLGQLTTGSSNQFAVRSAVIVDFERRLAQSAVDGIEMQKLSVQGCVNLILQITATDPLTIIIDALDEIDDGKRPELIRALGQIVANSLNVVKIFLTGRSDRGLSALLLEDDTDQAGAKRLEANKLNVKGINIGRDDIIKDMETYVNLQLSLANTDGRQFLGGIASPRLTDLLKEKLVDGAGESFQWVKIEVEYLHDQSREEDVLDILSRDSLPTLDDTYSLILERITKMGNMSQDIAIRAFSWLLYMKEAIPAQEFLRLVSGTYSEPTSALQHEKLIDICSNLVSLDTTCDVFRLSHSTVRDFLRRHELFSESSVNRLLAASCITVCLNGPKLDGEARALYNYAALYWPYHYSYAIHEPEDLWTNVSSFIYDQRGDSFVTWVHNIEQISKALPDHHPMKMLAEAIPKSGFSPIFVASLFGLVHLIEAIASNRGAMDWDQENTTGHTSFYLACQTGNISAAKTLLAHGANPIIGNPLEAASFAGHSNIVEMLLAQGDLAHGSRYFVDALDAAFRGGYEDIALMILENGAISNTNDYVNAVGAAAEYGFIRALDWLERPFIAASYDAEDPDKMSIKVTRAIKGGQTEIVQRLLETQTVPSSLLPNDALSIAAIHGNCAMVKLLVVMGARLDNESKMGLPLSCASAMGQEHVVRLLLELGAEVNNCDNHGTALQAAAMKGHTQIVRLILDAGAKVNQQSGLYGTALQAAAYHGHCDTVKALINSKAKMALGGIARDTFHAAVEGGHHDIVKWILDSGLKFHYGPPESFDPPPSPRLDGLTPPLNEISYKDMLAGTFWHTDQPTVSLNQAHGGYPEGQPYALQLSASRGDLGIVTTMLHHSKALGPSGGPEMEKALINAASNGHVDIVDLLIKATAPLPENFVFPALEGAIAGGYPEAIHILVENSSDRLWDQTKSGNLLKRACASDIAVLSTVIQSVQKHLTANDLDNFLWEGLEEASAHGRNDIIKWLFMRPTLPDQPRICKAFIAACKSGHESTVVTIFQLLDRNPLSISDICQGMVEGARSGHVDLVAYLSSYISSRGETANFSELLHAATESGHLGVVSWILTQCTKWLTFDSDVTTALVKAALRGHGELVRALLEAGADPNGIVSESVIDPYGHFSMTPRIPRIPGKETEDLHVINPLQAAIARLRFLDGMSDMRLMVRDSRRRLIERERPVPSEDHTIKFLLDHGADVNSLGGRTQLPIQIAAAHGPLKIVQLLINAGADVNAVAGGEPALFAAARKGHCGRRVVELLLDSGANLPVDVDSINRLLNNTLDHFQDDPLFARGYDYIDYTREGNLNDMRTVFTDGPGAVIETLLKTSLQLPPQIVSGSKMALVLQRACIVNKPAFVRLLLFKGVDVNAIGGYYGTALQAAARLGHSELVQFLLEQGADPNMLQGKHHTALRAAIIGAHTAIVEALLQHGTDINLTPTPHDGEELSPLLTLAAEFSNAEIVSMLVAAGTDVLVNVEGHQHPLIFAAERGNLEMVQCLLTAGTPANIATLDTSQNRRMGRKKTPLHVACYHGHEEIIQLLIDTGAEVEKVVDNSRTPLELASESGQVPAIRLLLRAGVDVNNGNAMYKAAAGGHFHAVSALLAAGATVCDPIYGTNAMLGACSSRSIPTLELLLEAATGLPNGNSTILEAFEGAIKYYNTPTILDLLAEYVSPSTDGFHKACVSGSVALVSRMLDNGMAVNAQNDEGTRALDLAARYLHPEIVQCLLDHGADQNYESPQYSSVINAAILGCGEDDLPDTAKRLMATREELWYESYRQRGGRRRSSDPKQQKLNCAEIVRILLRHGVNTQVEYRDYGHSLHLACIVGVDPVVQMLLSKGVDVNSRAGYFEYPLLGAIHQRHAGAVKQLLENGANPDVLHPDLGPALSHACKKKDIAISRLLLDHGADRNIRSPGGNTALTDVITMGTHLAHTSDWAIMVTSFLGGVKRIRLCDDDLIAAATYWSQTSVEGWSVLELLLDYDTAKVFPESALVALLQSAQYANTSKDFFIQSRCDKLRLLLRRSGGLGVTKAMMKNVQSKDEMMILLAHEPRCRITANIAEAQQDWSLLKLLLDAEPNLIPSEKMVMLCLSHPKSWFEKETKVELLEEMWKRNPSLKVNEEMLARLIIIHLEEAQFLLSRTPPEVKIPLKALSSAGEPLLQLVFKHKPDLKLPEATILRMLEFNFPDVKLDILLKLIPNLSVSEAIFLKVFSRIQDTWKQRNQQLVDVLKKHGRMIHFSEDIRKAVDAAFQKDEEQDIRQAFYNLAEPSIS
ncbi:ankyrin repeat-containing domain protein [Xylaria sp. FL1042]|nr:ankyrin repeat-containing domain protein [Xylaria sp. FL1042]